MADVVTVTSVDGRQVARTKADGTVGYTVSDLRPGTYILTVTARGFRPEAARRTLVLDDDLETSVQLIWRA